MDEDEVKKDSLGAYENMERSDIRPGFYHGDSDEDQENDSGDSSLESSLKNTAKDTLRESEKRAAGKVAKKVVNVVTGGKGGKVVDVAEKAAEKTSEAKSYYDDKNDQGDDKKKDKSFIGKLKGPAMPLVFIMLIVILIWASLSFVGQSLFPAAFQALTIEENDAQEASNVARSDYMADSTQLSGNSGTSEVAQNEIADVIFDELDFTDDQIQSFRDSGLDYQKMDDGSVALVYQNSDGGRTSVVSADIITGLTNGEALANGDTTVTDSGTNGMSDEEARQEILARLDLVGANNSVKTLSEALKDWNFRGPYVSATKYWRGAISGWYTDMREVVREREGVSWNNWKNYTTTNDEKKDEANLLHYTRAHAAANEKNSYSDKSLMERAKEVAKASEEADCGVSSSFTDVESVTTAIQTSAQVSAGSMFLESIDKTRAGEGTEAPLNPMLNIVFRSGAVTSPGMYYRFTGSDFSQSDTLVKAVSAQAHGIDDAILANTGGGQTYRECIYVGNTNEKESAGAIVTINSVFRKIVEGIKSALAALYNFFFGVNDNTTAEATAEAALTSTISEYEKMRDQIYFNGNDDAVLGEALISSSDRLMNEQAKSSGLNIGDENALLATYRAEQDVIAEKADYDQHTKSPFDTSSKYTFLGSIAYSLIPLATSSQSLSLTSSIATIGNLVNSSISNLLPTSRAIDEAQVSRGDCVLSNNIGAVSNVHCNNYYNPDFNTIMKKGTTIFDKVANLRYDEGGYVYGTEKGVLGNSTKSGQRFKIVVYAFGTNNRGNGVHGGGAPTLTQSDINDLASHVSDDTIVFLVGNYDSKWTPSEGLYNSNNDLLRQAALDNPNWYYLDWPNTVNPSDVPESPADWYVHPNDRGQKAWVDLISNAVKNAMGSSISGSEVAILGDSITNMTTSQLKAAIDGACVLGKDGYTWDKGFTDEYEECSLDGTKPSGEAPENYSYHEVGSTIVDKAGIMWGVTGNEKNKGTRENKEVPDWGNEPLNAQENVTPAHWVEKVSQTMAAASGGFDGEPNGCESDWESELLTVRRWVPDPNDKENGGHWEYSTLTFYHFDHPIEWSYSRYTNFEYNGYQSGWHNRTSSAAVGIENAQNVVNPEQCVLDLSVSNDKQPVINNNGAFGTYLIASGQRASEWGVADDAIFEHFLTADFTHGRLHPCYVDSEECGDKSKNTVINDEMKKTNYARLGWTGDHKKTGEISDTFRTNTVRSPYISRWIGGTAYVYYNGGGMSQFGSMNTGFDNDSRFKDETMGNNNFWDEMSWYQSYNGLLEWLETTNRIKTSSATLAVKEYYKDNPLDNSYEGIIARYSGLSKERVIAVLDLFNYVAFLNDYDPTNLYPLPAPPAEKLDYDNGEIIATAEQIIQSNAIVYDELRNRTVTV